MPLLSPVMLVLAHPHTDSLNHALSAEIRTVLSSAGVRVAFHDLYAEGFDPVEPSHEADGEAAGESAGEAADETGVRVADDAASGRDPLLTRHRADLSAARALVVVHPNWWGKPPAVMAGWLDRVLPRPTRPADWPSSPSPVPGIARMLVVNTSDTPAGREREQIGDPLALIWGNLVRPGLGHPEFERMVLPEVSAADEGQRRRWFAAVARASAWVSGAAR